MDECDSQNTESKCEFCQKPALHRCGACSAAHYCTRQHQKEDWKRHKTLCRPFKICEDATLGRHLVATRPLRPGDPVLREAPLVWGPAPHTAPVCLGCGRGLTAATSRPCSMCGWPMCSELCERSPAHLPECRYTSQRGERVTVREFGVPHPIYRCVAVLRCLYRKQFLPKLWRKLETLQTHHERRKATTGYESDRVVVGEFVRRFFRLGAVFDEEEVMSVYGMLMVNGHEVPLSEPPHVAVYGTASLLEHACSANCAKSFTAGGHIVITAATQIGEGEHISICYADPLWGTPNRRHFLHETKYFWCRCRRCEDVTEAGTHFSALKCSNTNCGGHLLPASFVEEQPVWACDRCGGKVAACAVHDVLDRIGRDLFDLDKEDVAACKSFLANYRSYLSDNHFYLTDVEYVLSYLLGRGGVGRLTDEDLALKVECCRKLEKLVKVIAPAEKRTLGTVLYELHAALTELCRRKGGGKTSPEFAESRRVLQEAVFLLKDEPEVLPEGKMREQAVKLLKNMDAILETNGC